MVEVPENSSFCEFEWFVLSEVKSDKSTMTKETLLTKNNSPVQDVKEGKDNQNSYFRGLN